VKVAEVNWAGTHVYAARAIHRPETINALQALLARAPQIRVLGTRHCFNDIADADELVSLEGLDLGVEVGDGCVTCPGAMRYGDLARALEPHGLALHNLASLPHISVAGAVATATHGSGERLGNLATAVAALELVTSAGELVRLERGDDGFDGAVVALGALGAVTRITLDAEAFYAVRQRVYVDLAWGALLDGLDELMAAGDSVSVFTRWGAAAGDVWVKTRGDDPGDGELLGARAATAERHPIPAIDPVHTTPQLGVAGPWYERLPHFRMGFTPSAGAEIQSEYHVPRAHATAAIAALRELGDRMAPVLLVSEMRAVAADALWLSPQFERDTLGFHFTWKREPDAVAALLPELEAALAPFGARPHWGKLFATAPAYPRAGDFRALMARLDPRGAFRNAFVDRVLAGDKNV
jgi:xylitol oxidase